MALLMEARSLGVQRRRPNGYALQLAAPMSKLRPELVDWSQAPNWANYYAKDRTPVADWDEHSARCLWFENRPVYRNCSKLGQWGDMVGHQAKAPDFGLLHEWGLVHISGVSELP